MTLFYLGVTYYLKTTLNKLPQSFSNEYLVFSEVICHPGQHYTVPRLKE